MDTNKYQKRKRKNRFKTALAIFICTLLFIILLLAMILLVMRMIHPEITQYPLEPATEAPAEDTVQQETEIPQTEQITETEPEPAAFDPAALVETDIYTFMQGPKAWEAKVDFSGEWCHEFLADQEFSVFGCGLCDLANIYSTLTRYDCSPLDMYYYAQEVSDYKPVSGYGAIDWPYLRKTLRTTGITSRLKRKDRTYEAFQEAIAGGITAIVLVCSDDDDTYWHDVSGHYVNIWLYNEADDTVFLADSGNPDHNRQRIPLRYIYDALKKSSRYQYLLVTDVDWDANTWQHDGIAGKWKKPKYYKK